MTNTLIYINIYDDIKMPSECIFDMNIEDIVSARGGLERKKIGGFFPMFYCPMSEEERIELKKRRELWDVLVNPDWKPEWVRRLEQNKI